jgi:hypothetical protein
MEKTLGVLEKIPAVVLKNDHHVLAVAKTKPDERGAQVQPIGHDKVKGPGIIPEEAKSGRDFVFSSPLRLHIQKQGYPTPDEHG